MAYDIIIRDAFIADGKGSPLRQGDIAIEGNRIAEIGSVTGAGGLDIPANGAIVAPGFIDSHTHDDRLVLTDRSARPKVSQGVTTVVTGNCGISLAPMPTLREPAPPLSLLGDRQAFRYRTFADYLDALAITPAALNVLPLVGHTTLRIAVMDDTGRPASPIERTAMADLLASGLDAGAAGFSSGLYYPPASATDDAEISQLMKTLGEGGGLYSSHIRDEGDGLMAALREVIDVAGDAGVPLVISHLKCAAPSVWGRAKEVLQLIEQARARQSIAFDVYPYAASSTMLRCDQVEASSRVTVTWSDSFPDKAGQDLSAVAKDWCCSPREAARRLMPGGAIYHKMREADVERIAAHPMAMIGSDGLPHDRHPHPRLWGTFPRILKHYVRDLGLFPIEEAIRKMTSLPAAVYGLADRGELRAGAIADLVMFDPAIVGDNATFTEPVLASTGIQLVIVNGTLVWHDGAPTGLFPGRVLRREHRRDRTG